MLVGRWSFINTNNSLNKNHETEALCQAVLPLNDVLRVIRDPEAGPLVKAAYSRYLSEVNL